MFGVGGDSIIWNTVNENGYTLFVEHDAQWSKKTLEQVPQIRILNHEFLTRCEPNLPIDQQPPINMADLLRYPMPEELAQKRWDVILIDGPTGFDNTCPGRALPIFWSSLISDNTCDIFVDDYSRPVEFIYTNKFLFPKYNQFYLFEKRLQLLWLKSESPRG